MDAYGKYRANERVKHPYAWAKTTVHQILSNPIYLGKLVSQRYKTKSFKDKRIVPRLEDEWFSQQGQDVSQEKYTEYLMRLSEQEWNGERASYQKEADGCQRRISELDAILKKLYEDRVFGIISEEDCHTLESCYLSCLKLAEEKKLDSIVFCCISTGEYHFPNRKAEEIVLDTVLTYLDKGSGLKRISLCQSFAYYKG